MRPACHLYRRMNLVFSSLESAETHLRQCTISKKCRVNTRTPAGEVRQEGTEGSRGWGGEEGSGEGGKEARKRGDGKEAVGRGEGGKDEGRIKISVERDPQLVNRGCALCPPPMLRICR